MKTFTKTLILAGMLASPLLADWDIEGQITAINPTAKTITIAGMGGSAVVQILPYTKLKGDDCGPWGNDVYGTFADLKQGMFVEAEVYPAGAGMPGVGMPMGAAGNTTAPQIVEGAQFVAKEVEWKCMPRAY